MTFSHTCMDTTLSWWVSNTRISLGRQSPRRQEVWKELASTSVLCWA